MVSSDVLVLVTDSCEYVLWERNTSDAAIKGLGWEMILDYRGSPSIVREDDRKSYRIWGQKQKW